MTVDDLFFEYRTDDNLIYSLSPTAIKELTAEYGIDGVLYVCGVIVKDNRDIYLEKYCESKNFIDYGSLKYEDNYHKDIILDAARIEKE